jgi:hypothetical protein
LGGFVNAWGQQFISLFFGFVYVLGFDIWLPTIIYLFCMVLLMCGKTTWKYCQSFCFIDAWGLNSRRLCVFFVVLLMHEDLSCWSSFKYFVVMWMCGSQKLEVTWVFLDSIDAWRQQFTSFMAFVVVLICGGFQCWPVSCNYVNFYNFLFCAVVLIWRKSNKDVLVVTCKNDMTPQKKAHYKEIKNYMCNY